MQSMLACIILIGLVSVLLQLPLQFFGFPVTYFHRPDGSIIGFLQLDRTVTHIFAYGTTLINNG